MQLLIDLYREEDEKFGVRYQNGVLQNQDFPLNPKFSKAPAQSLLSNPTFSHLSSSKFILLCAGSTCWFFSIVLLFLIFLYFY